MTGWCPSVSLVPSPAAVPVTRRHDRGWAGRHDRMSHHPLRRTARLRTQRTGVAAAYARLVRRVVAESGKGGDLGLAGRLSGPGCVNHGGRIPDLVHGPEAIKVSVVLYRTAVPAFRVAGLDLVAEGQAVALGWTAHGVPGSAG